MTPPPSLNYTRQQHFWFAIGRRKAAKSFIHNWNCKYPECQIPLDWRPWPQVRREVIGIRNALCFVNAKDLGKPMIVGLHFDFSIIINMRKNRPQVLLPVGHAVNLDPWGRIIDVTWGSNATATGLFVGQMTDNARLTMAQLQKAFGPRGEKWR